MGNPMVGWVDDDWGYCFHSHGIPKAGWFLFGNIPSINGWWCLGVPLCQETSGNLHVAIRMNNIHTSYNFGHLGYQAFDPQPFGCQWPKNPMEHGTHCGYWPWYLAKFLVHGHALFPKKRLKRRWIYRDFPVLGLIQIPNIWKVVFDPPTNHQPTGLDRSHCSVPQEWAPAARAPALCCWSCCRKARKYFCSQGCRKTWTLDQ